MLTEVYVATSDLAEQRRGAGADAMSPPWNSTGHRRSKKALETESRRFRDQRQRGTWSDDQLEVLREIYKDMVEREARFIMNAQKKRSSRLFAGWPLYLELH